MANQQSIGSALAGGIALAALVAIPRAEGSQRRPVGAPSALTPAATASDTLPRDPALTVGTLPNGIHYYIRVNKAPAQRAYLWLAVNAGSAQEDEDQQGFAHFLEHMAFNGTTHFPRNELISALQHAGMRFGADVNAFTSFDETVYQLEVPTDDGKSLSQGLTMLQDWAGGGMLIDSAEVVAERGVVLGEWRSRMLDSMTSAVMDHRDSVIYGADSRYLTRKPIGLPKLLETAQLGPIRRFYQDWYRPDLMAVVAVGDFDPEQMEREIKARFGKIPATTKPRSRVSSRLPSNNEPIVDIYRGPVAPTVVLAWKHLQRRLSSRAAFREQLVEDLLFEAVNKKLLRMRQQERRPFLVAEVGRGELYDRNTNTYVAQVLAQPDSLEGGVAAVLVELERAARYGVPAPALERQKAALLRRLEGVAASAIAMPSVRYAEAYAAHYLRGNVPLLSAAQEFALARELLSTITPHDLARKAGFWHDRNDLIVLDGVPAYSHVRTPTREGLLALLDSVAKLELAPDSARMVADAPLLEALPAPGRIVGEKRDAVSGVTEWKLSNGARVLFKSTQNDPDEVLLDARSPGGFSLVPDTLFFSSGRLVAKMMTEAAGVGKLDRQGLLQDLATTGIREFKVAIDNNDESIRLGGSPKDLETIFQLLYLQFTAPKLDTAALATWKHVGMEGLQPSMDEQLTYMLSRGDPRRAPTPWMLAQFADLNKAMAVYRDRFGNAGDFTFTIVGAATSQQVRPLVERYVASLPSAAKREQPKPLDVRPWKSVLRQTARALSVPKASTFLLFDGRFPEAPDEFLGERERLNALAWVLRLKFTEIMRERMSGTYSVGVSEATYADPEEHFRVAINFDAPPERINEMLDTLSGVLDAVRARGATAEELAKVEAMQRRGHETSLQENDYWLRTIQSYDRLRIPFARIVRPGDARLTPADVKVAAQRYLPATAYIQFTYLPIDTTLSVAKKDSTKTMPPNIARRR